MKKSRTLRNRTRARATTRKYKGGAPLNNVLKNLIAKADRLIQESKALQKRHNENYASINNTNLTPEEEAQLSKELNALMAEGNHKKNNLTPEENAQLNAFLRAHGINVGINRIAQNVRQSGILKRRAQNGGGALEEVQAEIQRLVLRYKETQTEITEMEAHGVDPRRIALRKKRLVEIKGMIANLLNMKKALEKVQTVSK